MIAFNPKAHRDDRWRLKATHLMRPLTVRFPDLQKVSVGVENFADPIGRLFCSDFRATCAEWRQETA